MRNKLLKVELLPYQLEGIAFAAGSGPGHPGRRHGPGQDDPGRRRGRDPRPRGRHQQGAGGLPRLAQVAVAERDPAASATAACSLSPAAPPSGRGTTTTTAFFTVCNYEQVLRDILAIERVALGPDHPRRRASGSRTGNRRPPGSSRGCSSPFALVLSGTPLENRLDELYSVVQFVDDRRLPPAFRFFHRHRVVDEKGKVLGYKNLDQLRERLRGRSCSAAPATRCLQQLPPRTSRDRPHSRPPTSRASCTPPTCGSCR